MVSGEGVRCETLIRGAGVVDGSGRGAEVADVAISGGRIVAVEAALECVAETVVEAEGLLLAPGFIDVHTHDDLAVLKGPEMVAKLSQGVTTVIVGNCGISASPVRLRGRLPDPMNLLGEADEFRYATFAAYKAAVARACPAVNVAALVGHTSLRNNHMDDLDRVASGAEVEAMRAELQEALDGGALGLSTGLAYLSAMAASREEVMAVAGALGAAGAVYATHLRSETETILDALEEACAIGRAGRVPVVVSHLKCAGLANWGRSGEVLAWLERAQSGQTVGWDCYPYAAGSSTLDLRQVDERVAIQITWSDPFPELAGRRLAEIAAEWGVAQVEAARRLQPAGAIYHSLCEADMRRILAHPATMIGSDGLPNDPRPHPRLWGTFPRVLGHYCREEKLFSVGEAVHKMTQMPAQRYGLEGRGSVATGCYADLVLFDAARIRDRATYDGPPQRAEGIECVWVNGTLSYRAEGPTGERRGRFVPRGKRDQTQGPRQGATTEADGMARSGR